MLFLTAKLDTKKILMIVAAVVLVIAAIFMLAGNRTPSDTQTAGTTVTTNDDRVAFLKSLGWDVNSSPTESGQVRIPDTPSETYNQYNTLQKNQGYDLSQFAGKTVMRYVYAVNNYPGATEPVYATLLIYKNSVIGGDITDTAAKGHIHPLSKPESGTTVPTT